MSNPYFAVRIEQPEKIFEQAIEAKPSDALVLGREYLSLPLVVVHSDYSVLNNMLSMKTAVIGLSRILDLPSDLVGTFLPFPDRVFYSHDTRAVGQFGVIFDKRKELEYQLFYSKISPDAENLFGIKFYFGRDPDGITHTKEKPIDSFESFKNELYRYSFVLEDLINGIYEELVHIYLQNPALRDKIGFISREPEYTSTLVWKPSRGFKTGKRTLH